LGPTWGWEGLKRGGGGKIALLAQTYEKKGWFRKSNNELEGPPL